MRATSFRKKILSQAILTGLGFSMAGSVLAAPDSDFYTTSNSVTVGTSIASVNTSGIISTTVVTEGTSTSTLPNITIPLSDLQTASTHQIRVGVKVTSGSNVLEVRLGVVNLTTDGSGISTFELADAPADPGYEKTYAYAKLSGNITVQSVFNVPSGMITASGNNITLNMSTIINEIDSTGAVADALTAFTAAGTLNYKVAINQISGTDGASAARLGHYDGSTYTPSPQAVAWEDVTLSGNFSGASILSGSLVIEAASTGGGGTTTPDPDETTVPVADITDLESETEQLDEQVDADIQSGTVSDATVNQTEETTSDALNQTNTLVSGSNTGTIQTGNTLDVLSAVSSTALTGSKVVSAAPTKGIETVALSTQQIITNTATLLETIADSGSSLTSAQQTQVEQILVNLANAANNVTSGSNSKQTTALYMKQQLEMAFTAATQLKTPISDETETALKAAAVKIQVQALAEITGKNGDQITQEDLQNAFNDPATRDKVLAASPKLPLKNPRSDAEIDTAINDYIIANYPAAQKETAKAATEALQINSNANAGDDYNDDIDHSLNFCAFGAFHPNCRSGFSGFSSASSLSTSGAQLLAATDPAATVLKPSAMTYDVATATTSMPVGDDIMKFAQLGQKAVPAGLAPGAVTQPDGRMTLISSQGTALDLAPTAEDIIAMAIAVDAMGFPMTSRDDGSFELSLAGNDKFTGTFAFETLPAGDRAACGAMTFTPANVEVNQPDYVFTATCENGISQSITPFAAEADLYESLANGGLTVLTNRNTGVISVEGVGEFKPSFFSSAPTEAEAQYQAANADSLGISYMPMDINGDGRMDFKVITPTRVQVIYAVP